jgi:alkylation response protein AidB-like acyl-CoA dehydrogenase
VNFELTNEQKQIKKAVMDFVRGEFKRDVVHDLVQKEEYPRHIWKKSSDLGLPGIAFPESFQGEGMGVLEKVLIAEELCRGDASIGSCLVYAGYGAEILLQFGSYSQKKTWLPKIACSEVLSSVAFFEPGICRLSDIRTVAEKVGNNWVVNGAKSFVINAGLLAGFYIVLCRANSAGPFPEQALNMILIETDHPGVITADGQAKMGLRMLATHDVRLDNVCVPIENLVGNEGQGYRQLMNFFNYSQLAVAAQSVGIAQGAFDRAFAYVKQRKQFGRKIIDFQISQHKLADMATDIEAARLLTYQAAWKADNGGMDARLCAMANLHATRTALAVCDETIQLLGGYGYMLEYEVERFFRDAKTVGLMEGSRHVIKNKIFDTLVGKSNHLRNRLQLKEHP